MTVSRTHNGGNSKYKFYNKENASYVRIYAPRSAVLVAIDGQTKTNFAPLINHRDLGYKTDSDLAQVENSTYHPLPYVDVFEESDKKVFGFWMVTKPRQTQAVVLRYYVPELENKTNKYKLEWQKQPGTITDGLRFSFRPAQNQIVSTYNFTAQTTGNLLLHESNLSQDRSFTVGYK